MPLQPHSFQKSHNVKRLLTYDMVVLKGMSPKDALKVAKDEQEVLDEFFEYENI